MRLGRCFSRGLVWGLTDLWRAWLAVFRDGGAVESDAGPTYVQMSMESRGHERNI